MKAHLNLTRTYEASRREEMKLCEGASFQKTVSALGRFCLGVLACFCLSLVVVLNHTYKRENFVLPVL